MRSFAIAIMLMMPLFAFAEERSLVNAEATEEKWITSWTMAGQPLVEPLQHQRGILLRVMSHYLLREYGAFSFLLMREEPASLFGDAATDLVRAFPKGLREITLDGLKSELALENGLAYMRGHSLSESGVTRKEMKDALDSWLYQFNKHEGEKASKYATGTTVLRVDLAELRLASKPSPEFRLLFSDLRALMLKQNVINLRVIVSATPDAWKFVWDNEALLNPFLNLGDSGNLTVIDGSKLEIDLSCVSLLSPPH